MPKRRLIDLKREDMLVACAMEEDAVDMRGEDMICCINPLRIISRDEEEKEECQKYRRALAR